MKTYIFITLLFILNLNLFAQEGNYRDSIDVLNYDISITEIKYAEKSITANTKLRLKPIFTEIHSITLDLLALQVDSVFVNNKKHPFRYEYFKIKIPLKEKQTSELEITVFYQGKPTIDSYWGGFYFEKNYVFNYGVGMASSPPNFGRVWFPCIDNFTDRATYNFHITTDTTNLALANGVLQSITKNGKNHTFHWKLDDEIPTYLASLAVGKYIEIKDSYKNARRTIPISIYVPPAKEKNARKSFRYLKDYVQIYETLFGEYVWDKIGYVTVPFRGGAMEHLGLISLSNSSIDGTLRKETLIAHELVHHWFGNLVTCETEKDMWLNEGWASYCEALMIRDMKGEQAYKNYNRQNHANVLTSAHKRDGAYLALYGIPHKNTYGSTVYDKGADVVYALNQYLGDSLFLSTTKKYLKEFAFKTANTKQFIEFYSVNSDINLADFSENWIYTKGFPHFSISDFSSVKKKKLFSTKVKIKQKLKKRESYSNSNLIDLFFIGKDKSEKRTVLFSGKEQEFDFKFNFEVLEIIIDKEEKLVDAAVRNTQSISTEKKYIFEKVNLSVNISALSKTFDLQVSKNFLKADKIEKRLFTDYYWTVSGLISAKASAILEIKQAYQFYRELAKDEVFLYYRKNASKNWRIVESKNEVLRDGLKLTINLLAGEYCVAFER